ncbi:hypothetical protein K438DRAFT_1940651 [Mycena galopus ATCC 62051]|nr:hypothetical protein K438DRAFT_1940651 [Mycena galopus ATCC 62051]
MRRRPFRLELFLRLGNRDLDIRRFEAEQIRLDWIMYRRPRPGGFTGNDDVIAEENLPVLAIFRECRRKRESGRERENGREQENACDYWQERGANRNAKNHMIVCARCRSADLAPTPSSMHPPSIWGVRNTDSEKKNRLHHGEFASDETLDEHKTQSTRIRRNLIISSGGRSDFQRADAFSEEAADPALRVGGRSCWRLNKWNLQGRVLVASPWNSGKSEGRWMVFSASFLGHGSTVDAAGARRNNSRANVNSIGAIPDFEFSRPKVRGEEPVQ